MPAKTKPESVIIDGVRYVPATEVSIDTQKLVRALVATWWGWPNDPNNTAELDDPKRLRYLRVVVSDGFEDGKAKPSKTSLPESSNTYDH